MKWDGLGRRVSKKVLNSGDWSGGDCTTTYHYYYDGHSIVEERNESDRVIKQHVWGTQYIDELVQTAINPSPVDCTTCGIPATPY